jgi:site-specific DNA-methyltransferase (adenine-specific)
MKPYILHLGNMLEVLDTLEANSIDAVVTDPPYEINFMNKGWDNTGIVFQKETWEKVLRVLKPGGHMLAFNHSRTFHRMAIAIEDAGFQIRDTIMWLYGSGFPKSHDVSKAIDRQAGAEREIIGRVKGAGSVGDNTVGNQTFVSKNKYEDGTHDLTTPATDEAKKWEGWGSALKPSYEPIILARKPLDGTIADNVLKYSVGGLNIDECRVFRDKGDTSNAGHRTATFGNQNTISGGDGSGSWEQNDNGRFPANTIHDGSDEVIKDMWDYETDNDASRYFYTAKASKKDKDEGLDSFATRNTGELQGGRKEGSAGSIMPSDGRINPYAGAGAVRKNIHPTVKPTDLMQYLIRLITPKGGTVLDPFMGSGSTGKAAMIENNERNADYRFIGIELNPEYIDIAAARIEYGINYKENKAVEEEAKQNGENQLRLEL